MNIKNTFILLFFILKFNFSYTQTGIKLKGKIIDEDGFSIMNVDVVNFNTKELTVSDKFGFFSIVAKAKDTLVFISKNHELKKLLIEINIMTNNNLIVKMSRKPEELDEVLISKINFPKIKFDKASLDQLNLEKSARTPKNIGVYDGKIENGIDIIRILSMGWKLFSKPHEKRIEPKITFKNLIKKKFGNEFFIDNLKLKKEQIEIFIEFCDADPKSKSNIKNANELNLIDFLYAKNIEFKKISAFKN